MASWFVARACACSALALGLAVTASIATPARAAEFPTVPKALTKPKDGEQETFFEAIGVRSGFVLGYNRVKGFETTVYLQRFGADGRPDGRPVKVEGPAFMEGLPEFVDLGGDKVGVMWKVLGPTLKAAVFDAASGRLGRPVTVLENGASSFIHDMALLAGGKVGLVTRSHLDGGEDTTLTILSDKMKPVTKPKVIEDDVPGGFGASSYEQTVVAHDGGGVALFRAADNQLDAVPFTARGGTGRRVQVNTTTMRPLDLLGLARFNVKAEPLPTGGYVVTWMLYDTGSNLDFDIRARVFDRSGKPVGPDFLVNQDLAGSQSAPEILMFDSSFAVSWTDNAVLGQTTQVLRFFDFKGKPLSDDIVSEYYGADGEGLVTPSTDTEFAQLRNGSQVKIFGAEAKLFGDRVPAPSANGSAKDDMVVAAAGNDDVSGGAGHDAIDAGDGDDTVDGGPGNDLIVAGAGNDDLTGGDDPDVFVFRPGGGSDVIQDFETDDRIDVSAFHYNQHANVLADAVQQGPDVVITLRDHNNASAQPNVVRLKRRTLAQFTAANIIL